MNSIASTPLVTVVLATYNQQEYVQNALESIMTQTYKNLEIIVCDNGSTDNTKAIIRSFVSKFPNIVFLDYKTNKNITIRHNHYINIANGEFVSILFGDDYYLPKKIEKQVETFLKLDQSWGVVYGPTMIEHQSNNKLVKEMGLQKSGYVLSALLNNWHNGGIMNCVVPLTRTQCYKKYLNYEDIFTEGEGVFLRIAIDYKFYYHNEPLAVMTEHENNYGKSVISNIKNHDKVLSRMQSMCVLTKDTKDLIRSHRSVGLLNASWHCIRTNVNAEESRSILMLAIKIYPLILLKLKLSLGIILTLLPLSVLKILNKIVDILFEKKPFVIAE
ncbi:glycosyltransferase family 2 protein [Gammaproteobacteria bacterium]|nr:glycosyltransferase family 2 protein [Gammaproteobacteria bacterium]